MVTYGNAAGSSIVSYQVSDDALSIKFRNGQVYTYTRSANGDSVIDEMIALAESGSGLNSYLRTNDPSWS